MLSMLALPAGLSRDLDNIVGSDAEAPHGTFDFRMPQQQLDRRPIAGTLVDQNRLRPTQLVDPESRRIKSNAGHPL